jgi:hypothetical protein
MELVSYSSAFLVFVSALCTIFFYISSPFGICTLFLVYLIIICLTSSFHFVHKESLLLPMCNMFLLLMPVLEQLNFSKNFALYLDIRSNLTLPPPLLLWHLFLNLLSAGASYNSTVISTQHSVSNTITFTARHSMKMAVILDVALCSHCPDDGGSKHLWNVSQFLQDYTVQHPKRQLFSFKQLSEFEGQVWLGKD